MKIQILKKPRCVPQSVMACKAFKWDAQTFVPEDERLDQKKFIEASTQLQGLEDFVEDSKSSMIYAVSGSPDDAKARYFAAFLVQTHINQLKSDANPLWVPMYGGFDNPYMERDFARPSLLVLSNLTANSTNLKLEKARDLLEKYDTVPRIIVSAGIDPMSFMATRLFMPVHALAYFSESLFKKKVEVI